MKEANTLEEMIEKGFPDEVVQEMQHLFADLEGEYDDKEFDFVLGGKVYLVEEVEDLSLVDTCLQSEDASRWLNLSETAGGFDDARYTEDGTFAVFFMATNNAGGPVYYVPREVADRCPNVEESIRLTNGGALLFRSIECKSQESPF
jgi:hypothetical protein